MSDEQQPRKASPKPPPKRKGSTSVSTSAAKARGIEMLAAGMPPGEVAQALGRHASTVSRWGEEIKDAVDKRLAEAKEAAVDGAAEAKRLAREHAPEAVMVLINEMRDADDSSDRRAAAVAVLDRGGVGPKQDHGVTVSFAEELAAAVVRANRKANG